MDTVLQQQRKQELKEARANQPGLNDNHVQAHGDKSPKRIGEAVNSMIKKPTPFAVFSLLKHADFLKDSPFIAAFLFAMLKDIFDIFFSFIGLSFILSILCSIFIFMMLVLAGAGGKGKIAKGFISKSITITMGGLADAWPGLAVFVPSMAIVGVVYLITLKERADSAE